MARTKNPEETRRRILQEALKLFVEKGYDNTSIQDILKECGGLSKGAIYHHFQSKEAIFEGVGTQIGNDNIVYYDALLADTSRNGFEKLKIMFASAYENPHKMTMIAMMNKVLQEPKFFKNQILEIYEFIVPRYVLPVIQAGVQDGSITGEYAKRYPKELAEMLLTLLNIWVNPVIAKMKEDEVRPRIEFFAITLRGVGLDILDEAMIENYIALCHEYRLCLEKE